MPAVHTDLWTKLLIVTAFIIAKSWKSSNLNKEKLIICIMVLAYRQDIMFLITLNSWRWFNDKMVQTYLLIKIQYTTLYTDYCLHSCSCLATKLCLTLWWPHGLQPAMLLCPWNSPGKNTGCHFLFQGIFLTQGLNPHLRHCRWILYHWAMREAELIG